MAVTGKDQERFGLSRYSLILVTCHGSHDLLPDFPEGLLPPPQSPMLLLRLLTRFCQSIYCTWNNFNFLLLKCQESENKEIKILRFNCLQKISPRITKLFAHKDWDWFRGNYLPLSPFLKEEPGIADFEID
jgi:hypothetical protein